MAQQDMYQCLTYNTYNQTAMALITSLLADARLSCAWSSPC
jgi:hypothetical protein